LPISTFVVIYHNRSQGRKNPKIRILPFWVFAPIISLIIINAIVIIMIPACRLMILMSVMCRIWQLEI